MKPNSKMILMLTFGIFSLILSAFILPKPVCVYADEIDETEIDVSELFDVDEEPTRSPGIITITAVKLTAHQAQIYTNPSSNLYLKAGDYRVSLTINNNQGITNDWAFSVTCNSNLVPGMTDLGDVVMQASMANNNMSYNTSWNSLTHEIGFYAQTGSTSYDGLLFSFYLQKSANTIVNQPIISVHNYTLSSVVHFSGTVGTSVSGIVGDADGSGNIAIFNDYTFMNTILTAAGSNIVTASNYELYLDNNTRSVVSFAILDADGNGVFNETDRNAVAYFLSENYLLSYNVNSSCDSTSIDTITVYYD